MSKLMLIFAKNHPSLAGHFPDNPIIPGVMILEEVLMIFQQQYPELMPTGFATVKFLKPLKPEHSINIAFNTINNKKIKFICSDTDSIVTQGEIKFSSK